MVPARIWRRLSILLLVGSLLWLSWMVPSWGSARLESRLSRLEFDVRSIQASLRRLDHGGLPNSSPAPPRLSPSAPPSALGPTPDRQFDNLATLAVETKRDLQALEARVAALEERLSP